MKDNSFEKQISEKLSQSEIQPSEGLLNSIFEKRASKPKGFAGIGYSGLVLAAVLVVSFTAFSLIYWKNDKVNSENHMVDFTKDKSIETSPKAVQPEMDIENSAQSQTIIAETQQKNANSNRKRVETSNISSRILKKAKREARLSKNIGDPASNNSDNRLISSLVDNNTKLFVNYENYFNANSENRPRIDKEYHNGNSHLYVFETANDEDIAKSGILYTRQGRLKKKSLTYEKENIDFATRDNLNDESKFGRTSPLFIDFLISPSFNTHRSVGNSELNKVSNGMTKMSTNLQTGVRVSKPISNKFNVFTGLFYNSISNAYQGEIKYESNEIKINKNISYINDPVKGIIQVVTYDTVNFVAQNTQNIDFENTYQLFQVPIGFSYNFGYRTIDFSIHGSALFNVIRNSKGYALNTELHNSKAFESTNKIMGIGAGFSVMSAYKITPKFRFIVEPGFQYYGINAKKAGNNMNEKTFNTQLTLGLRYTVF
ncbi:MAG: hypothetical protein R2852_09945 [Bacteroidia bacterium]